MKIYLAVKMRLVILENGTDNSAEDLSVKLYDRGYLIKAWFWCLLESAAVPLLLLRLLSLLKCWKHVSWGHL